MENNKRQGKLDQYTLYNLKELEDILGIKAQTMKLYIHSGKLKATKVGGKWKVSERQLKDFLNLK